MNRRQGVSSMGRGRDNRPAWLVQRERDAYNDSSTETNRRRQSESEHDHRPPPSKKKRIVPVIETVRDNNDASKQVNSNEQDSADQMEKSEATKKREMEEERALLQLANNVLDDDGEEFLSQQENEEQEARKRRENRRRRLRQAAAEEQLTNNDQVSAKLKNKTEQSIDNGKTCNDVDPVHFATEDEEQNAKDKEKIEDVNNDEDDFDMFSSSVSPPAPVKKTVEVSSEKQKNQSHHHQQDWDDEEGYYKATIGEEIDFGIGKFRVLGIVGKGVFSTVLKCETLPTSQVNSLPQTTAIKLIRHNETMAKAAMAEIRFLQTLRDCSGICSLRLPSLQTNANNNNTSSSSSLASSITEHKGHVGLVFDFRPYNLRHVLQKFGKGVGLTLQGVRTYFYQLIQALQHLEEHKICHADLKPDNILVNETFSRVELCDFGSAFEVGSDNIPTPYLVSRFYRAPEIILGVIPSPAVDLWSVAVSMGELFLGKILFDGRSNNNMLLKFMESMGCFSNRILRQHTVACQKFPLEQHFFAKEGSTFVYHQTASDKVTGKPVTVTVPLLSTSFPKTPLQTTLLKARSQKDSRVDVLHFSDLMHKCLALDPSRRIPLAQALQHDFFKTANKAVSTPTI